MHVLSAQKKLIFIIVLTAAFCIVEIVIGLRIRSLALIADSFHYLFDFGSYLIAFVANKLASRTTSPERLTFGWARARVLGSFVNGVALAALGFSIFIQSLQRFVNVEKVRNPQLMLVVGCIGLALNIISLLFFHNHGEQPDTCNAHQHSEHECSDLSLIPNSSAESASSTSPSSKHHHDHHGFAALFLHAVGDAAANCGVILAAAVIWKSTSEQRYYADPALSLAISLLIVVISMPLIRRTGLLLAESTPENFKQKELSDKILALPGIVAVHTMKIWRLNEQQIVASAHVVLDDKTRWIEVREAVRECFYTHGIHMVTIEHE